MNSSERRSSRSIKRKRFDDEIVDYTSLPSINRGARPRTQSQSNTIQSQTASSSSVSPNSQTVPPPPASVPSASTSTPPITSTPPVNTTTKPIGESSTTVVESKPLPESQPLKAGSLTPPKIERETVIPNTVPVKKHINYTPPTTQVKHNLSSTPPQLQKPVLPAPTPIIHSQVAVSSPREPIITTFGTALNLPTATALFGDRRMKAAMQKKKPGRRGGASQLATKDLGRWKPVDDLALIIGVQQTNDLKMVHRGTKFSCKFTLNELQNRWYALMYEESVSRIAVAAMRNLHPELVENIQSKALYSAQEEEVLSTIKSVESPTLETFAELLGKHSSVFYSARTPKTLQTHWQLMKQYSLLPDQAVKVPGKEVTILSFSDNEEMLNDAELTEPKDEVLDSEMTLVDRRNKKDIRQLETQLGRWNVLVDSMTGMGFPPEFDRQTLAVLRGRLVRYLMRSREITIGRSTKDATVDVDLGLEGPAYKVSRKQGTIKLRSNADFFLTNEGKRPIYVEGEALLKGYKTRLSHNCVIEVAGLRFTFLVNFDLINAIQQESAKMNTPLT